MKLSDKLAELRRGSNLSQEELAEKLGVSRQAVSKWESGTAQPELQKLIELSNLYNVSVDELLSLEHTQEKESDVAEAFGPVKAPEKLTPRAFAHRYKRPLLLAAALLLLLTAIFVRNSRRIRSLSRQVEELRGQIVSVQQSLAGQIAGIGSSVEDILQREASLVSQYEYTVTDVDLEAQECTLSFSILPKSIPENLRLTLIVTDEDEGTDEQQSQSVVLTQDSFNTFRGSVAVPLSDRLSVSACFESGGETQVQQLDTIYGLQNRYSPQMLEFFPIRSYTRSLSNQPWQYCFRSGEADMDAVIGYVSLGALGDRQIRKAYIDYVSGGRSVQRVPLEAQPYESDMAAPVEKYFGSCETESILADSAGYDLYYAEEAKSMSFTLPLTPPLTIDLVLELSDGTVLRATQLTVKATQNGDSYEEVDYPKGTKGVSFSIVSK